MRGNLKAYGSEIGNDGLPSPYQSYMVWATELTGLPDPAVASIITLSEGQQFNRQATGRSEQDAFDRAYSDDQGAARKPG